MGGLEAGSVAAMGEAGRWDVIVAAADRATTGL